MAKRYKQKEKDAVVAFIQQFNEKNGRGGQTAAVNKYGVTPITVRAWMDKAGVPSPGKGTKKKGPKAKAVRAAKKATVGGKKAVTSTGGGASAALLRMVAIQSEIQTLQSEYASLKEQI